MIHVTQAGRRDIFECQVGAMAPWLADGGTRLDIQVSERVQSGLRATSPLRRRNTAPVCHAAQPARAPAAPVGTHAGASRRKCSLPRVYCVG